MQSTEKDFNIRKSLVWSAAYKMNKLWKSSFRNSLKVRIVRYMIRTIYTYGDETLKTLHDQTNCGYYTRLPSKRKKTKISLSFLRHDKDVTKPLLLWII